MRIGLTTAAFYGRLETEDAAWAVAELGLPCCEVFLETYSEYSAEFGRTVATRLGKTRAVSIHAKSQHFESDFMGQSARQRSDAYRLLNSFLDAGKAMGASTYVYHGPARIRGATPMYSRWQEPVARAIADAAAKGLAFSWETVSWCHLASPGRVTEFRGLWPDLSFVLDTKQVFEMRQDPLDYVRTMGDRLRHVHVLDFDADGRHVLPGQGVHDFADFACALEDSGYCGDIILEPYASQAEDADALLRSIDWLRNTFRAE